VAAAETSQGSFVALANVVMIYTAWRMTSPRLMTSGRPSVSRISVLGE
jgi:hypothetical protein